MNAWPSVKIGEVAKVERKTVVPSEVSSGTACVGLENITRDGSFQSLTLAGDGGLSSAKLRFDEKHVLYGKLRPYLAKVARPWFSGVCSTDILPILPGPGLDRAYLFHFLRRPEITKIASLKAAGVNLPRISPTVLLNFDIPLPSLREQQQIAAILDQADMLRARRREALAQLGQLSQSTFVDIFGSQGFDHWPTLPLCQLVAEGDAINYGVVQPGDNVKDGVPLLRVSDLVDGRILFDRIKKIDPMVEAKHKGSRLRGNEILISCVGSIGKIALVPRNLEGFNIARALARVPLLDKFDRTFIAHYLRTDEVQRHFKRELRTVAQPTLNIKQIAETRIIVPPVGLQREFAHQVEAVERLQESHRAHLAESEVLFESLQHRAFRGEL